MLVVHGTWAAPHPDKARWHQPCDDVSARSHFITRLDAELEKRGSPARCWAHCSGDHPPFRWSGGNSWIERTHAAVLLAEDIARLKNAGWRCHVVAHSHGGNVAVEALQQVTARPNTPEPDVKLVTLGTPFLDAMAPILARADARKRVFELVYKATVVLVIAAWIVGQSFWFWQDAGPALEKAEAVLALPLLSAAVCALAYFVGRPWLLRRAERKRKKMFQGPRIEAASGLLDDFGELSLRNKEAATRRPVQVSLLAIGSSMDEAWQVLHHLRRLNNPLASEKGLFGYLLGAMRSHASQGAEIARIQGARSYGDLGKMARLYLALAYFSCFICLVATPIFFLGAKAGEIWSTAFLGWFTLFMPPFFVMVMSATFGQDFLSAFLAPFRWIGRGIGALLGVPAFATTYFVRRKGWSVLLAMAMGMEGYRFPLPAVARSPCNVPNVSVTCEDMPRDAEARAMAKRNAGLAGILTASRRPSPGW